MLGAMRPPDELSKLVEAFKKEEGVKSCGFCAGNNGEAIRIDFENRNAYITFHKKYGYRSECVDVPKMEGAQVFLFNVTDCNVRDHVETKKVEMFHFGWNEGDERRPHWDELLED